MGAGEAILLAGVVRLATWGSSIPNAVLVARSAAQMFGLSLAWGFVIAASLELIGHALIEHWQSAKDWNSAKRAGDPAVNVGLALALVIGYFIIDLAMVGALAYGNFETSGEWQQFLSLSYPLVGVGVALATDGRARLFRLKQAVQNERAEKAAERAAKRTGARPVVQDVDGETFGNRSISTNLDVLNDANRTRTEQKEAAIVQLLDAYANDPNLSFSEAGRVCGRSKSWAAGALAELEAAGKVRRNGHGVEILEG